jgi:hypothetical protein
VKHLASRRFWQAYERFDPPLRERADRAFELLKENPGHPSLQFKKIGRFWSARIGLRHRALAVENDESLIWFWVGNHADYDRLLKDAAR